MNIAGPLRICLYLCLTGLLAGCAGDGRQSGASAKIQRESVPPLRQTETGIVRLSSGDSVLVTVEVEPSGFLIPAAIERQVSTDGTLELWGAQRARIAGRTLDDAASTIRLALITNYIGFIFREVNVIKVQPPG
jgi:protein involved in polysaccharide export with SLBB domain